MGKFLPSISLLLLSCTPLTAAEQCVTLGDSLTFAYEAEFGFDVTIFGTDYGDGFGSEVKNWIEILDDTSYRNPYFDQGARDDIRIWTGLFSREDLFFRKEYNWAVPGMLIDQLRRFITEEASLLDLLDESPSFESLRTALVFSDYDDSDFDVADLRTQIENTAERLTLFIGGNDINSIYGTIYDGGSAGTFVADFIDDAAFIIDWVQTINPNIQIVLANVPHVGITPDVQTLYPTDPVKTERVSVVLRDLNAQLKALAESRSIGYADIFSDTLSLLSPAPLCIHGITFTNAGSTTGDLEYVWLNGPLSANFHPNTNAHTLIANEFVYAFNKKYNTGIAPLTATEMLGGLHGKTNSQIDMPFTTWMSCHGLPGLGPTDDSDGDQIPAGLEFALGLNPTKKDAELVTQSLVNHTGTPEWQIAYPIRIPASIHYNLTPAHSTTLSGFTPLSPLPLPEADGRAKARIPITGAQGFLRLESTVIP